MKTEQNYAITTKDIERGISLSSHNNKDKSSAKNCVRDAKKEIYL